MITNLQNAEYVQAASGSFTVVLVKHGTNDGYKLPILSDSTIDKSVDERVEETEDVDISFTRKGSTTLSISLELMQKNSEVLTSLFNDDDDDSYVMIKEISKIPEADGGRPYIMIPSVKINPSFSLAGKSQGASLTLSASAPTSEWVQNLASFDNQGFLGTFDSGTVATSKISKFFKA